MNESPNTTCDSNEQARLELIQTITDAVMRIHELRSAIECVFVSHRSKPSVTLPWEVFNALFPVPDWKGKWEFSGYNSRWERYVSAKTDAVDFSTREIRPVETTRPED